METAILMAEDRNEARKSKENLAVMLRRNNAAKRESLFLGMYMYVRMYVLSSLIYLLCA